MEDCLACFNGLRHWRQQRAPVKFVSLPESGKKGRDCGGPSPSILLALKPLNETMISITSPNDLGNLNLEGSSVASARRSYSPLPNCGYKRVITLLITNTPCTKLLRTLSKLYQTCQSSTEDHRSHRLRNIHRRQTLHATLINIGI